MQSNALHIDVDQADGPSAEQGRTDLADSSGVDVEAAVQPHPALTRSPTVVTAARGEEEQRMSGVDWRMGGVWATGIVYLAMRFGVDRMTDTRDHQVWPVVVRSLPFLLGTMRGATAAPFATRR